MSYDTIEFTKLEWRFAETIFFKLTNVYWISVNDEKNTKTLKFQPTCRLSQIIYNFSDYSDVMILCLDRHIF